MSRSAARACIAMWTIASTAAAADSGPEVVVYTALRPSHWDLYLFDKAEQPPRQLTDEEAIDYNAAVSPDGRWLVFCSERGGNPDLHIIDLNDPGAPKLLLDSDAMEDAPAFSPDGKHLAFVSTRDDNADIYVVPFSPDGLQAAEMVNLTQHAAGDFNPAFSPDGKQIAFSSDRDRYKASEIYVMHSDGSAPKRLTSSANWDGSPAWSADGEFIYSYSAAPGRSQIYRMSPDGSGRQQISRDGEEALSPTITPTGRIAYAAKVDDEWQVVSVNADGTDHRIESDGQQEYWAPAFDPRGRLVCHGTRSLDDSDRFPDGLRGPFVVAAPQPVELPDRSLTVHSIRGSFPSVNAVTGQIASDQGFERVASSRLDGSDMQVLFQPDKGSAWRSTWTKDGRWLACGVGPTFARPGAHSDIWKFQSDGSEAMNLTNTPDANDAFPHFSPDGTRIAFRSGRDGNHEIYVMNSDGSQPTRLTNHEAVDTMPAFSPDGNRIAFTSRRDGDYEIYILALESNGAPGELVRVTNSPRRDTHPKFSPDGNWLVFASERGGMNDESPLIPVFNPQPYGDIFAKRLADRTVVRLTHNKWEDGTPTWGALPPD